MANENTVAEIQPVGRPTKATKHKGQIAEAESRISDKLPELADEALKLALGTSPEKCRRHRQILTCPNDNCKNASEGVLTDPQMVKYLLNRVMGNPGQSVDRMINMEFVDKVTKHITTVFHEANRNDDAQERANVFAQGIAQLWVFIGRGSDDDGS